MGNGIIIKPPVAAGIGNETPVHGTVLIGTGEAQVIVDILVIDQGIGGVGG